MKKVIIWIIIFCAAGFLAGFFILQNSKPQNNLDFSKGAANQGLFSFNEVSRGRVSEILNTTEDQTEYYSRINQQLKVLLTRGSEKGKEVIAEFDDHLVDSELQKIKIGDEIVLGKITDDHGDAYVVIDRYRLPLLGWFLALFVFLAIIFGRKRGLSSILGLGFGILVLFYFIAPNILAGKNPALTTMVGAGIIAIASMFLAHGFRIRTCLALISMLLTLGVAEGLAYVLLIGGKFFGLGADEAFYLQQGFFGSLNLQGLLLAGIIISSLGVLDDVTAAQAATIEEIYLTDTKLTFKELFNKGTSVGQEHIASLVNTLVLAYAGASLPLFLLLILNSSQPLWAILNSESLAEEIARTLIGSIALILSVPITTAFAAYYFTKTGKKSSLPNT